MALACAPARHESQPGSEPTIATQTTSRQPKTLIIGIRGAINGFAHAYTGTVAGGATGFDEGHSQGLVTGGFDSSRPVPRLASELPSLDRGTARLLPDGRLLATYPLRKDVTWADGEPFTSRDMMLAWEVQSDRESPFVQTRSIRLRPYIQSMEAPDDYTFTIYFRAPFYLFNGIGLTSLWPLPSHLLRPVWERRDMQAFENHRYWTEEYFHIGPYRPVGIDSVDIVFVPVDTFFLGQPKIDKVILRQFGDASTLYAAVLAHAVHMTFDESIEATNAYELKRQWEASGEGRVLLNTAGFRRMTPQFGPELQMEPALLDPRVRVALYHIVNKESLIDVMVDGNREFAFPDAIWHRSFYLYPAVKGGLLTFSYDPDRALRLLADAGWTRRPDGTLVNGQDGRRFRTEIWDTDFAREASMVADMFKQVGIEVTRELTLNPAQRNDNAFAASYPGFEVSGRSGGPDGLLTTLECPQRLPARTRYCNDQMTRRTAAYQTSLSEQGLLDASRGIQDLILEEVPVYHLYWYTGHPAILQNVKALDDYDAYFRGDFYNTAGRHAYLWDLTS